MIKDTNALCVCKSWQHYKIPFTTLPLLPTCCNASNFIVKVYPTWSLSVLGQYGDGCFKWHIVNKLVNHLKKCLNCLLNEECSRWPTTHTWQYWMCGCHDKEQDKHDCLYKHPWNMMSALDQLTWLSMTTWDTSKCIKCGYQKSCLKNTSTEAARSIYVTYRVMQKWKRLIF